MCVTGPLAWKKNIPRGMRFKFEYLGEFEFILKNNLRKESGDQVGSSNEKRQR